MSKITSISLPPPPPPRTYSISWLSPPTLAPSLEHPFAREAKRIQFQGWLGRELRRASLFLPAEDFSIRDGDRTSDISDEARRDSAGKTSWVVFLPLFFPFFFFSFTLKVEILHVSEVYCREIGCRKRVLLRAPPVHALNLLGRSGMNTV